MADLITLDEYKELLGLSPQTDPDDAQVTALLPAASRSIRKFTDRKFEIAGTPATRTFQYEGENILDIDDATEITAVSSDLGYTSPAQDYPLDDSEWTAMPFRETTDDDPYYYIVVATARLPASPEMGFERNLDTLGFLPKLPTINITASWGWPVVPADVKLATAITAQALMKTSKTGDGGSLTSEAIAGYARSWSPPDPNALLAIPNRARDLLLPYQRVY